MEMAVDEAHGIECVRLVIEIREVHDWDEGEAGCGWGICDWKYEIRDWIRVGSAYSSKKPIAEGTERISGGGDGDCDGLIALVAKEHLFRLRRPNRGFC
ncbi:hypothetical protein F2Q70_00026210 [Brassica cretica]|uniref:Uncharacterized protein n=1 Tax=Brassica cretica TaxID=69181 RepID=A0A8S9I6V8_BRACR|nr:hypothetical protein F2Q68_00025776 [Brassica cretica]KAF2603833.1 hypothetical protein F2Q70_00026210 [Brassica cretica]